MNTTTLPALPRYFTDDDGVTHKLTTRTDHYGRWADPQQRVGYMYESACGLGTDEYALILGDADLFDSIADEPVDTLCPECLPVLFRVVAHYPSGKTQICRDSGLAAFGKDAAEAVAKNLRRTYGPKGIVFGVEPVE